MLAPLDNEVVFKKAFTERKVLIALVKDIVGIDFNPGPIETEKSFFQNPGNIDQKYDVYAESVDHRIVVELQKIEYDYHFDRFLYYHNMAVNQLQKTSNDYKLTKTVYTLIFLTQGYKKNLNKTGEPIKDSVLISDVNPRNLKGRVIDIYGHKIIFLNSFYKDDDVPPEYKDWLELISESINNPKNYHVNKNKKAIEKVTQLIEYENMRPDELRKMKIAESKKAKEKIRLKDLEETKKKLKEEKKRANKAEEKLETKEKELETKEKELETKDKELETNKKELETNKKELNSAIQVLSEKLCISIKEAEAIISKL